MINRAQGFNESHPKYIYLLLADYCLGSFIIIKFADTSEKFIQNSIDFREYTLVLKTIIVTDEDCYIYNRVWFTDIFRQVQGRRARNVKFNKMLEDEERMTYALYIPVMKSVIRGVLVPPPLTQEILTKAGSSPIGTITHYKERAPNSVYPRVLVSFIKDEKNKGTTDEDSDDLPVRTTIRSTIASQKCIIASYSTAESNKKKENIPKNKKNTKKKSPVWPKEKILICKSFVTLLKRQPIASYINAVLQLLINMKQFNKAISSSSEDYPLIALLKELSEYSYFDATAIYHILREEYDFSARNNVLDFTDAFLANLSRDETLNKMIASSLTLQYKEFEVNKDSKTELARHSTHFISLDAHTSHHTLSEMVEDFFAVHEDEGKYKVYRIEEAPEFLMIHINRLHLFYDGDRIYPWKITKKIEFNHTLKIENDENVFNYNLYGLVSHHGYSIEDDNYVTYIKNGSEWYEFNNEELSVVSDTISMRANYPNTIGKKDGTAAIMYFYEKTTVKRKENEKKKKGARKINQ